MKLSRFRPALVALLCGAGILHADVVTLKDGKKLEGNILSQGPAGIRMRYRLTPKIWDEKNILSSDIAEIVRQKPEEVELIELRKELPTPDLMSAEKYEQLIQDRLRPFVNRYPGTKEAEEVGKIIAQVQEEKEKVVAGGAKLEGKWLTPDEVKAESYNIKASALRAVMNEKAATNDFTGALKEFEKLSNPQTGFIASVYFPKAVEEATAVLTKFEAQLEQMIKDQPTLQSMRDENAKKLIEPDLSRMKEAVEREKEQWKTTLEQERKSSSKWFTPYKYDLASLKDLAKNATTEKARLKEMDVAILTKVNDAIGRTMRADAKAAKSADELKKLGDAIMEGEQAAMGLDNNTRQTFQTIFQGFRARYAYAQQQLAMQPTPQQMQAAASAAAGAAAGTTAIAGTGAPGTDDRVAAALAAASGTAPAAPGAMPVPGAPAAVPGVTPAAVPRAVPGAVPAPAGTVPAAVPGAVAPATGYPPQQPGYAQPQPAPAMPMAEETPEGMSTNTMLLIGMGVVIIVLLLAMMAKKKK